EEYYERIQSVNRFVIASLLLTDPYLMTLRRDIRKLASGLKVETGEIEKILRNEVLKRDVIEGEEAKKAAHRVKKQAKKAVRKDTNKVDSSHDPQEESSDARLAPTASATESEDSQ
ncbi:MAG: hypothetical protein ABIJ61_04550, partial [bacterium]